MASILDTAIASDSFKTLVTAIEAAGLANLLAGPGPFTVFAPNDHAFSRIPKRTVEELLKNELKVKQSVTYHIISGRILAADVTKLMTTPTVQGQDATLACGHGFKINEAKVVKADIICDNGVIHMIDAVLTAPAAKAQVQKPIALMAGQ